MSHTFRLTILPLFALAIPASASPQLRSERRVVGDTTVVRTLGAEPAAAIRTVEKELSFGKLDGAPEYVFGRISGVYLGPDGGLWVFDMSVPALRRYDSTGKFIRQVGRAGPGPGEYSELLSLATLPDGGAVIFDPRNAHLLVYNAAGQHTTDWSSLPAPTGRRPSMLPGPSLSMSAVFADRGGTVFYSRSTIVRGNEQVPIIIRLAADGRVRDTIVPPVLRSPTTGRGAGTAVAAFAPRDYWAFSPFGYLVGGRSDTYAIHLLTGGGKVTRIERDIAPIAYTSADRQRIAGPKPSGRGGVGPVVPSTIALSDIPPAKPFFKGITVDNDGRVWVSLHTPTVRVLDTVEASQGRGGVAIPAHVEERFGETILFEVFAPDGRYLGRVRLPDFIYPPTIKGNAVWAAPLDADGVPTVIKYRIVPPLPR